MKYLKTRLLRDEKPDEEIIIIMDRAADIQPLCNQRNQDIGCRIEFPKGAGYDVSNSFNHIIQEIKEI